MTYITYGKVKRMLSLIPSSILLLNKGEKIDHRQNYLYIFKKGETIAVSFQFSLLEIIKLKI